MTARPGRKSTAKNVKRLPNSAFAYRRTREYPINTRKRARNALARAAQSGTSGTYGHVRRQVLKKYPSMKKRRGRRGKRK